MWEQYKKTVRPMQFLIVAATAAAWIWSHHWEAALAFFVAMQCFAAMGAMWGWRLRNKVLRAGTVPTRQT